MLFGTVADCAVVLDGKLYMGGGYADRNRDMYVVQVYDPESGGWSRLPECPVKWFAVAVVNHQLVLVGGSSRDYCAQSTLQVLDSTTQRWTTPYPRMPTARWKLGAVGYKEFLVAVGGVDGVSLVSTVEILNSSTKRWYTAAKLPIGCEKPTSAVAGDTLYVLGGRPDSGSAKTMLSISLPALISHATSTPQAPPPIWDVIDVQQTFSSSVSVNNHLLAVGGKDDRGRNRCSSAIHLYNPQTRQWTKVGDIPTPLSECSCTVLSSGELVALGGWDGRRSNKVYIGTVM